MTVHLHDYGQVGVGSGGAPINYSEVSRLILAARDLAPARHDFHALVAAGSAAALRQVIRPGDTLVCTAGPYAHLYHYWREQSGIDFRIVRDARTTAWTPYLAQEWLAAPLLRDGDTLILPSDFAREFYHQLFPHLAGTRVCVLYPLAAHLPAVTRAARTQRRQAPHRLPRTDCRRQERHGGLRTAPCRRRRHEHVGLVPPPTLRIRPSSRPPR